MRKQIPLLVLSAVIAVFMLAVGGTWWAWLIWSIVVFAQIGKGLGWHRYESPAYVPASQRPENVNKRRDYQNGPEWDAKIAEALARREQQQ